MVAANNTYIIFLDGSSGYGHYRWKGEEARQNNLLVSTMIILRLEARYVENGENLRATLFENLMPNSPYSITPLRMKFEEETTGIMLFCTDTQT